jgi:nucleotide-binding universal stress UspA family protein
MGEEPTAVVVGYDGSTDADLALDWAESTVGHGLAPLHVMIVGSHMDPVVGHHRVDNERLVDEWHRRAIERLKDHGVANWDVEVARGPTVPVLLAAADRAAMLVVGSRGHSLLFGSVTGSVSQHVARHACCPVVVVRSAQYGEAGAIVVGIDGSGGSEAALRFACARAQDTGQRVVAIHSYRGTSPVSGRFDELTAPESIARMEQAERLLTEEVAGARGEFPDVHLTTRAVAVPAGRLLVDRSASASLLVVGSRGRDAFTEMLLGSVAQHVLQHARCPVAVVR